MKTVDGRELFSERIGNVILIYSGARDPADVFALRDMPKEFVEFLSEKAPPICV